MEGALLSAGGKGGKAGGKLALEAAKKMTCCFGCLPKPPGGWYGPFGFLRLVSYAFMTIFAFSCVVLIIHFNNVDWMSYSLEILLAVSSLFCAFCAYSHELLMNQTTAVAKQNDLMSKSLDKLDGECKELGGVNDKLGEIANKFNVSLDVLEKLLAELTKLADLEHTCELLKYFMVAEAGFGANKDGRLDGDDLIEFLEAAQVAFIRIPNLDRVDVYHIAQKNDKTGVDVSMLKLLVNSLTSVHDEHQRAEALSALFLWSMDPTQERMEKVLHYKRLFKHPEWKHGSLENELRAAKSMSEKDGSIDGKQMENLREVFCFAKILAEQDVSIV